LTKAIPRDRLVSLIDEAALIRSIRAVVFTGGECFLLGKFLDQLIEQARRLKLRTRCVTNAYWASSAAAAARRVEALSRAGLEELNISTGSFHAEYVPIERIVHAAVAAAEADISTLVSVEIFEGSTFDIDPIVQHPKLNELAQKGTFRFQRHVWMNNEGQTPVCYKPEHSRFQPDRIDGCRTALNVIAVTPDQDLIACCGLHLERIPELHLGSISTKSIAQVLADAPDDFLKIWIHVAGPERILQFVKDRLPDYELPVHSVHPCETCLHLHSDKRAMEVIEASYKEVEKEIVPLFMAGLAQTYLAQSIDRLLEEQRTAGTMA
jgi:organic radical activating enzyme